MDYNRLHADRAAALLRLSDRRVLHVGCNTGETICHFITRGAFVDGLDVIAEIGQSFRHERARYLRSSVESIPVADATYDLVYSVATMEHVPDIFAGFREMARVTKPGGFVYCVSSPLWNSRFGHHKIDIFGPFPWAHLRFGAEELLQRCEESGLHEAHGLPLKAHVDYIFDPRFFNRRPASDFRAACAALPEMRALQHDIAMDDPASLSDSVSAELARLGYSRDELLAVTHTYIARKRGWWRRLIQR